MKEKKKHGCQRQTRGTFGARASPSLMER